MILLKRKTVPELLSATVPVLVVTAFSITVEVGASSWLLLFIDEEENKLLELLRDAGLYEERSKVELFELLLLV